MASEGKIDGVLAAFTYDASRFTAQTKSGGDVTTIERDHIIGFLPSKLEETSSERNLLYVEVLADASGAKDSDGAEKAPAIEARTVFRSLKISDAPTQMLQDYAAGDLSWLLSNTPASEPPQDGPDTYYRVTVIVSTGSGSQSAAAVFDNLVEPFLAALAPFAATQPYHVLYTTSAETITTHTRTILLPNARAGRPQTLLLLTGDGGPVDVLNALLSPTTASTSAASAPASPTYAKPTLALIACGTGNALAHSSAITPAGPATLGLAALLRGRPTPLPLFRATLPPGSFALDAHGQPAAEAAPHALHVRGAVVFSWCLHASLVADSDTPAYRAHGAARFQAAGKENLFPADGSAPHVYRGRVEVRGGSGGDGSPAGQHGAWRVLGDTHSYLLLTLVARLEAAFCISPASRPLDGRLRVVRLPPLRDGGVGVMRVMEAAYAEGAHVGMEGVGYEEVGALRMRMEETEERWRRVCVDGTIFVVPRGEEVVVEREEVEVVDLVTVAKG